MAKLDPRIEAIRVKYDLAASDFWELPQKRGTWIAKHSALEIVAAKANIVWTKLEIIESDTANGIAVMAVGGKLGEREEWATGEASPKNNKNAYPWAMAEKRAKDRVVLKLSGIAGLVYSEDEADDFKQPLDDPGPVEPQWKETKYPLKEGDRRKLWERMMDDLNAEAPKGSDAMIRYMQHPDTQRDLATLEPWKDRFRKEAKDLIDIVVEAEKATGDNVAGVRQIVPPNFDAMDTSQ